MLEAELSEPSHDIDVFIFSVSGNEIRNIDDFFELCQLKQDCHDGGVPVIATTSVEILLSSFEDQSCTLKCLDGRESFIRICEEIS